VTALPTCTVRVPGVNAKLSIETASPATGVVAALEDGPEVAIGGIELMPGMPVIPGVMVTPDPNVTDGLA
jgi:hypothetical protein